ncbi:DUF805 domain-containing protein [Pediococcus pentosaceus]|uniref:DUF805 domain-containing protein n=1 Tax=Pediococcus pentosaceus TaxID=1255 RepID=UPI0039821F21
MGSMKEHDQHVSQSLRAFWQSALTVRGEASQEAFVLPVLVNSAILFLIALILVLVVIFSQLFSIKPTLTVWLLGLLGIPGALFALATIVPTITLIIRRLRNMGLSIRQMMASVMIYLLLNLGWAFIVRSPHDILDVLASLKHSPLNLIAFLFLACVPPYHFGKNKRHL